MTHQRITPHLWFDTQAVAAAEFYAGVFPDSEVVSVTQIRDTPSGDCDIVEFRIMGYQFMAISAGPLFQFNPSISFQVKCGTAAEVDAIWEKLSVQGSVMMPLGEYPFSRRFGWVADQFGVSWQVMLTDGDLTQRITPMLMFTQDLYGQAEEAINFYAAVFPNSSAEVLVRYEKGEEPEVEGAVKSARLLLDGQEFALLESALAHEFGFNEAISLIVHCKDQGEIDHYWETLSAVPEAEQCGWLKDRYGVSWQIVPEKMEELMARNPEKTTPAMLEMKKIIIADLIKAGESV